MDIARGASPFELDLGRQPTTPAAFLNPSSPAEASESPTGFVERIRGATISARDKITLAQGDYVAAHLAGRTPTPPFAVGDMVLVEANHAYDPISGDRPKQKLSPRWVGPWPIIEVLGPATYRLQLPPRVRIHPVLNVERLRRFTAPSVVPGRVAPSPTAVGIDADGHQLWAFERILDKKTSRGKLFYLVQWTGHADPSWEPAAFLASRQLDIDEFERSTGAPGQPARAGRRSTRRRRIAV